MLREEPIPAVVHGAWEYSVALLFVAAPFLFGFDGGTTIAVCIVVASSIPRLHGVV